MKGITFGEYHSYDDLNLILKSKEIGSPPVKEKKIEVEGADGDLDLTGFFGEVKYSNVRHKFNFSTLVAPSEFLTLFSKVKNAIHGRKMRIVLDDDPHFYYYGRLHVSNFTNEKNIGIISVECDCEPYKLKLEQTVLRKTVNGSEIVTLTNSRKRAVPTITTTASMTLAFGGGSWTANAGTFRIPELELTEGENVITVTGSGTITFTWQEGEL